MIKTKQALSAAAALILLTCATQANATPVTQWAYTVQSGYSAFGPAAAIPDGVQASVPNPGLGGLPTVLSWGEGASGPSQMSTTPTVTGSMFTNSLAVNSMAMTYTNNPTTGTMLDTATLVSTLLITPVAPVAGFPIGPIPILFNIVAGESALGDIFVLQNDPSLSFDFILDSLLYTVTMDILGLNPLSNEACTAANAADDCIGFIIPENEMWTMNTTFAISADIDIPEPGILSLFGIGLLGLMVARRRKLAA